VPGLVVTQLPPSHYLILNKFAVVPEHFILVTKAFKPQSHILEEDDLAATYACIKAYNEYRGQEENDGGLYAFFNSGTHSGSSQPHRHIQLLPIQRMHDGLEKTDASATSGKWSVLADRLRRSAGNDNLPFKTFSAPISPATTPAELYSTYLLLYKDACAAVAAADAIREPRSQELADTAGREIVGGEAQISYNLAMTMTSLVVCPRLAEGATLISPEGKILGSIALNGTLLAGTALVKNEVEWDTLQREPEQLLEVMKKIGVPKDEGTKL
jgi:sulfate adenylyltransferase (ADP) / ATP adenylyltransferase